VVFDTFQKVVVLDAHAMIQCWNHAALEWAICHIPCCVAVSMPSTTSSLFLSLPQRHWNSVLALTRLAVRRLGIPASDFSMLLVSTLLLDECDQQCWSMQVQSVDGTIGEKGYAEVEC
jgi:hypothetical protein